MKWSCQLLVLLIAWVRGTLQSNVAPDCYVAHRTGSISECPQSCPVSSTCSATSSVRCVDANDCSTLHTAGAAVNGSCVYCKEVTGCGACASMDRCGVCLEAFDLQTDGTCLWKYYWHWAAILGVLGLVCLWVAVEFMIAQSRPIINRGALEAGLKHRHRTKVRDEKQSDHPMYPLTTAMHTQPICGPGMPLFMNWFVFVCVVALWQILLSAIFWPDDPTFDSLDNLCAVLKPSDTGDSAKDVEFDVDQKRASAFYEGLTPWVLLSYVGTLVLFVIFQFLQRGLWHRMHASSALSPMLHRYAVEARGFPSDATNSAELDKYWRDVLEKLGQDRSGLVEMSIAYDFSDMQDDVSGLIDQHLREEERRFAARNKIESKAVVAELEEVSSKPADRPGPFWVQLICFIMLGTDFEMCGLSLKGWSSNVSQKTMDIDSRTKFLSEIQSSGHMIVVFQTVLQKRAVRDQALPIRFRDSHVIKVSQLYEEPRGIFWENYGISSKTHRFRILIGMLVMVVVLVLWVVLYYPWSNFTQESIGTASNLAMVADLTISLTIPIGNALVAYAVAGIIDYYGFRHHGNRDMAYLYVMVPCLFVNVLSDIVVTMRNTILSFNEELADSANFISTFGVRSIVQDMFALLFPGYALIPYIGEPVCCVLLPFFAAMWRIKQDSRITPEYAEQLMLTGEIDLVNPPYGDIVASSATFMFTFLAPSRAHWSIWIAYFIFGAFLYAQNRYRILRWQTMTYFGTNDEHVAVSYLWGLPLGLLAASLGAQLAGEPVLGVAGGLGAFVSHNVLHFLFVRYVITWKPPDILHETYQQAAARRDTPATYRNTNPVEVLKNQAECTEHDNARLVFYAVGKNHIQPNAEAATYRDDAARTDLVDIVKHTVKDLVSPASAGATEVKSLPGSTGERNEPEKQVNSEPGMDVPHSQSSRSEMEI